MTLIRPRLNDFHNLPFSQADVDFAIPFLDEDIPLYVDPFLLWKITSQQDNALHTSLVNSFNQLGNMYVNGKQEEAKAILINLTECDEVGLGNSKTRRGKKIGNKLAEDVFSIYKNVPQIHKQGFEHFEEIQLLVDNISKDRISDITCSLIKSFLIDFTLDQCDRLKIPVNKVTIPIYDYKKLKFLNEETFLPTNPTNSQPLLLVPKRWLRFSPWINYEDYFSDYYIKNVDEAYDGKLKRVQLLNFNRNNYDLIEKYINQKESVANDCTNDPLFSQIPVLSSKRKLSTILALPTGKTDNADRQYEDNMVQLLSSLLYPHLDFAKDQSRTESGTQIRDLIFYNNTSYDFLKTIYDEYASKQLVVELKNVKQIEREHINQLNRYLAETFGKFGILFTRNRPSKAMYQNTIDLWSGQRRCILILDDDDLNLMCGVYDSKQRHPLEVIKKKYIEFTRSCPS